MEIWQTEHIKSNLYHLMLYTNCNVHLLSLLTQSNVLDLSESTELEAEKNFSIRAFHFYKKILTKGGGAFDTLLEALEKCKQSGAVEILRSCSTLRRPRHDSQDMSEGSRGEKLASITPEDFTPDKEIGTKDDAKAAIALYHSEMKDKLDQLETRNAETLSKIHNDVCIYTINYCKRFNMEHHELLSLVFELQNQFGEYQRSNQLMFNGNPFNREEYEPAIGIDLGTTNCCVGLVWDKKVSIIQNKQGGKTTPSYVLFDEEGSKVIGHVAKKNSFANSKNTIFDSKRIIGRTVQEIEKNRGFWPFDVVAEGKDPRILVNGERYRAWEISGLLLQECKEIAERHLQREVRKAVITVPAYFNQSQKKETQKAAKFAGLDILAIVNEPTAAAIAYRENRLYKDTKKVLVFDLGGGTFDVAVLEMLDNKITTKAVTGDATLGGEDFDEVIMKYCIDEFKKQTGIDLSNPKQNKNVARSKAKLLLECEEKKRDLGCASSATIMVDSVVSDTDLKVKITKHTFEQLCEQYFNKMISLVGDALRDAKVAKEEIDDVILVGGSTRIPKIQQKLSEYFKGKKLNYSINPDEAVAYGAAVLAAILNDPKAKTQFNLEDVEDVVAHSIGIEAREKNQKGAFSVIIPRNTKYPTSKQLSYSTTSDNQVSAAIKIYQGECTVAKDNRMLGEFMLKGIPPAPAGRENILIDMTIDELGILVVSATSVSSGVSTKLQVSWQNEHTEY